MTMNQIIMQMINKLPQNNPMAQNFIGLMQKNDMQGIEQMGKNILQSRGMTFEQAKQNIMKNITLNNNNYH